MRRLLILVSVIVFADTMLFSAIIPLIPVFAVLMALQGLALAIRCIRTLRGEDRR